MILVDEITIKEFRGIRELTLKPNGKNFAICGPNGTGKSGVVDAIEFVLTGSISRLSGDGRGELSILKHAPHVDSRDDPERAWVSAKVSIPSLGKSATITRTVKHAGTPSIVPADDDLVRVLQAVANHPEFALSRRELIKYVLATPGKRAEEVSALLQLERIGSVRGGLQRISNAAARAEKEAAATAQGTKAKLVSALGLETLSVEGALDAANAQRTILGLEGLTVLTNTTSLKDGVQTAATALPQRVSKTQATADIEHLRTGLVSLAGPTNTAALGKARTAINILKADPLVLQNVERESFVSAGLKLVIGDECPLCDEPWDQAELVAHVKGKVGALHAVAKQKEELAATLAPIIEAATQVEEWLRVTSSVAARMVKPLPHEHIDKARLAMADARKALTKLLPLDETLAAFAGIESPSQEMLKEVTGTETAVAALPEPSKADAAREWLTIAQERLESYREAKRTENSTKTRATVAKLAFETFASTADMALENIYEDVQGDFAALYAAINTDDEAGFRAKLVPSASKLGFSVDFYGKGLFPPGAYHSEGHQDGMGLCLYLALMRHLQGSNFRFALLDDVLMSVDTGHRREICKLLKRECPNTQFILTTHDRVWLRHMQTEGLIGSGAGLQFRSWDVEHGPSQWDDKDVWAEIDGHLKQNKVDLASGTLRKFLEFTFGEMCHALRARVEFRGDGQYQYGDVFPAAIGRMGELLRKAKVAAESWDHQDEVAKIVVREQHFEAARTAALGEQWQMNAAIHFNAWENLTAKEFTDVASAMRGVVASFYCAGCAAPYRVSPERGEAESLRCECGQVNLLRKTK